MKINEITEAVNAVPLTGADFKKLTRIMKEPLPVTSAIELLSGLIDDDMLYDEINAMATENKDADARILIANWLELNMPDKTTALKDVELMGNGEGIYSPLHGQDLE